MSINYSLGLLKMLIPLHYLKYLHIILIASLLSACLTAPVVTEKIVIPNAAVTFDTAIDLAVDDLLNQALLVPDFKSPHKNILGAVLNPDVKRNKLLVDVTIDSASGQQTNATRYLDARLLSRIGNRYEQIEPVPLLSTSQLADVASSARFLLVSTLTPLPSNVAGGSITYKVSLSITDLNTGLILAQTATQATATGVDTTPTRFYQDSPSIVRDRLVDGIVRTSQAKRGDKADSTYVSSLTISSLITEGVRLYDAGQFDAALKVYEIAAARADGKQSRVFNGIYLANMQLGRFDIAENAFGRIVSLGLANNNLAFKFLFRAGTTDFLTDTKISGIYPMWLNVLTKELSTSKQCVVIVGHSSKTGTEQYNDRLSLSRATAIQRRIEQINTDLSNRLQSKGVGFRENLVGTGTDDMRDALDRRVEFQVKACS